MDCQLSFRLPFNGKWVKSRTWHYIRVRDDYCLVLLQSPKHVKFGKKHWGIYLAEYLRRKWNNTLVVLFSSTIEPVIYYYLTEVNTASNLCLLYKSSENNKRSYLLGKTILTLHHNHNHLVNVKKFNSKGTFYVITNMHE